MARCTICPRHCSALRDETQGQGRCRAGWMPVVARAALHFGEEPCISGTRGSGTVFFGGCSLGCVFCQNAQISEGTVCGQPITPKRLSDIFRDLERQGAHNINLVTAGHVLPMVREAFTHYHPGIPVVYNSSGYETVEAVRSLKGIVDVFLPDFKYANGRSAAFCADAPDYPEVALAAIAAMREQTGPAVFDESGLLVRGTHVRHLVLPGLTGMSMRALAMLKDALPEDVQISLMGQYTPYGKAKAVRGLDRPLTNGEYGRVRAQMQALGFGGYVQPPSASGTQMIPVWDGTGVPG